MKFRKDAVWHPFLYKNIYFKIIILITKFIMKKILCAVGLILMLQDINIAGPVASKQFDYVQDDVTGVLLFGVAVGVIILIHAKRIDDYGQALKKQHCLSYKKELSLCKENKIPFKNS